jgi:hypothetical protein
MYIGYLEDIAGSREQGAKRRLAGGENGVSGGEQGGALCDDNICHIDN